MKKEIKEILTPPNIKNLLKPIDANEKKKTITLFMIIVFSMLLAMVTYINNFLLRLYFQIILFIAQLIIVKALLDDYYQ